MPTDTTSKLFKSGRISFAASKEAGSKVNAETRIISDVILCQVGEAKGHGVHLEQSFIEAGIAYAQKHYSKIGMKCRFGHPAMSNDALGTEVGKFHNFRVVDDKMVADLHIYASANLSPTHPGAGDWILSMAEEDPSAIMCSIVFMPGKKYQYDDEGNKYYLKIIYTDFGVQWGTEDPNKKFDPSKPVYVELKELWATDLVDEGAATDKLFSATVNPDKFAVIATQFLDEHPKIAEFLGKQPHKLQEFLTKYQSLKTNTEPMKIKFQKAWAFALAFFGLAETKEEDLPEVTAEHVEKLSAECTRLSDALGQAIKDKEDLSAQVEALGTDKTNLTAEVEKLTGQLAQETKDKAAYSALAEKYRAAAGDAFRETDPEKKTDELSGDQPKDKVTSVEESTVFKNAQKELANL